MKKKPEPDHEKTPKPKLTDAERHKRFVDMAHEVEQTKARSRSTGLLMRLWPPL